MAIGGVVRACAVGVLSTGLACGGAGPGAGSGAAGAQLSRLVPFAWPQGGVVTLMTCRFETERPIGYALAAGDPEAATAVASVLRAWERAGLGVRFIEAPPEHAQLTFSFSDEPLEGLARSSADCKLQGERAELAFARVELSRVRTRRGERRGLSRDELLGLLVRETGRALGWSGEPRAGDPLRRASLAEAARFGAALRAGEVLASPALAALYAAPSGSLIARAPAEPASATRPVDRLRTLAAAHGLDGPYLRTGPQAGRVFWRDPTTGDEYGAQVIAPERLRRAPGRIALALESRARRALPRSRDSLPESSAAPQAPRGNGV